MIAQIVVFSSKIDAQRKKNIAFRSAKIAQKFCEWKPYLAKQEDQPQRAEEQQEKTQQMGTFTYSVSSFPRKS